ncbi:MAG: hypothetical protein ACKOBH_02295 [bacterium]
MEFLTSLPAWILFAGSILFFAGLTYGVSTLLHDRFPNKKGAPYAHTAEYYNTVIGALFAFLTAFLINSAFTTVRATNEIVAAEASAANRVAWATRGLPSADVSAVQESLARYLSALETEEWPSLGEPTSYDLDAESSEGALATPELNALQQKVFEVGSRPYVPALSAESLQAAVDDLGSERRARLAAANSVLPFSLFLLAVISGITLIVNLIVTTLRDGRKASIVSAGIVLVVALDIALILGLTAPFDGPFTVKVDPLVTLYREISDGRYLPWAGG